MISAIYLTLDSVSLFFSFNVLQKSLSSADAFDNWSSIILVFCSLFCILMTSANFFFKSIWLRSTQVLFFSVTIYLPFQFTGVYESGILTMTYAIILSLFFNRNDPLNSPVNLRTLRIIQATILSTYFCAGLSKLNSLLQLDWTINEVLRKPLNDIAFAALENSLKSHFIIQISKTESNTYLFFLGFIFVLILQLTTFLPLVVPRFMKFYGFSIFAFHLATAIFMGIDFLPAPIVSLIFCGWAELELNSKPISRADSMHARMRVGGFGLGPKIFNHSTEKRN